MHRIVRGGWLAALVVAASAAACSPKPVKGPPGHAVPSPRVHAVQLPPVPAVPPDAARAALAANAARPFDAGPISPMRPFVLKTDAEDQGRAVQCLAQAIYYEAGRESLKGRQAVAQVVLNRLRHPAWPKSVCAVVYQGAAKPTGCQFTFTCDGALRWKPEGPIWDEAQAIARKALAGYVDRDVGSATHYHAVYVDPYWAPSLAKMVQVGQHIFYRWEGGWGEPAAFTGRYQGREAELTPAVLQSGDVAPPPREVTLDAGGESRTYKVADDAAVVSEAPSRSAGALRPTHRKPTAEEVKRINAHLEEMEKRLDQAAAPATP